jgi:hypothetical protein
MRDTAEAISRDTDVPLDWIRGSVDDLLRHDGLTAEQALAEVRRAYEATFHALAHRSLLAVGAGIRAARRRALLGRT